jgi:hypothetical protein
MSMGSFSTDSAGFAYRSMSAFRTKATYLIRDNDMTRRAPIGLGAPMTE